MFQRLPRSEPSPGRRIAGRVPGLSPYTPAPFEVPSAWSEPLSDKDRSTVDNARGVMSDMQRDGWHWDVARPDGGNGRSVVGPPSNNAIGDRRTFIDCLHFQQPRTPEKSAWKRALSD